MSDIKVNAGNATTTTSKVNGEFTISKHKVKIGNNPSLNLKDMKTNSIPFQGFRKVTKAQRAGVGVTQNAKATIDALVGDNGKLSLPKLLASLKTLQVHLDRQVNLGNLTNAGMDDALLQALAPHIQNLSNKDLSSLYQNLISSDVGSLKEALSYEINNYSGTKDAKDVLSNLFNLEALVLKEVSNRVAVGMGIPGSDRLPSLCEQFNATPIDDRAQDVDLNATNLKIMVETSASAQTHNATIKSDVAAELETHKVVGISPKEIGDTLRKAPLTINVDPIHFFKDGGILDRADRPFENAHHLVARGEGTNEVFTDAYMERRDAIEETLYPEFANKAKNPDERPTYAALNVTQYTRGAAGNSYGNVVLELKEDVAKRATFTANDTFFAAKLTIDDSKKPTLMALINSSPLISSEVKQALADPESLQSQQFETFYSVLKKEGTVTATQIGQMNNYVKNLDPESQNGIEAIMVKVFGDPEKTRSAVATYETLENLLPSLGEVNTKALALATAKRLQGGDSRAFLHHVNYIEAQIQGPLVIERDVAKIRVNGDFLSDEEKAKIEAFAKDKNIPIEYYSTMSREYDREVADQNRLDVESTKFNAEHRNLKAQKNALTAMPSDPEQWLLHVQKAMVQPALALAPEIYAKVGEPPFFTAEQQARICYKASLMMDDLAKDRNYNGYSSEGLKEIAFTKVFNNMIELKATLLDRVDTVEFANPEQKADVVTWVKTALAIKSVDELDLVIDRMKKQEVALSALVTNPNTTPSDVIDTFVRLAHEENEAWSQFFRDHPQSELGPDDTFTELNRSSFLAQDMLNHSGVDLNRLKELLTSPQVIEFYATARQLDRSNDATTPINTANISVYANKFLFTTEALGLNIHDPKLYQQYNNLSFNSVTDFTRSQLQQHFSTIGAYLDQKYPYIGDIRLEAFPKAKAPDLLPKNQAERRDFLIATLDKYLEHEKTFDQGFHVHGRGHIIRAFIFATALANKFEELGVNSDRNALLCGIACHDVGRESNGTDVYEAKSAQMCVDAMQGLYGADTLGEDYERELKKCIDGHSGKTAEALLLQAADSLDIGRTKDFDLDKFPFLKTRITLEDGAIEANVALRHELAKEAHLLQVLTNKLVENRARLNQEMLKMATDPDKVEEHAANVAQIKEETKAFFEKERELSNEEIVAFFEGQIAKNPNLFPFLSKYYH